MWPPSVGCVLGAQDTLLGYTLGDWQEIQTPGPHAPVIWGILNLGEVGNPAVWTGCLSQLVTKLRAAISSLLAWCSVELATRGPQGAPGQEGHGTPPSWLPIRSAVAAWEPQPACFLQGFWKVLRASKVGGVSPAS